MKPVGIRCPKCNRVLMPKSDLQGKPVQCPGCKHSFRVPSTAPALPSAAQVPPAPAPIAVDKTGPRLGGVATAAATGRAVADPFAEPAATVAKPAAAPAVRPRFWTWSRKLLALFVLLLAGTAGWFYVQAVTLTHNLKELHGTSAAAKSKLEQSFQQSLKAAEDKAQQQRAGLEAELKASEERARKEKAASARLEGRINLLTDADKPYEAIDRHALRASAEIEQQLDTLAKYLAAPAENDTEKARAIYRWVADRIAYDAESFFAKRQVDQRAEAVLSTGKGVCAGYANLFHALGQRVGLESVVVGGYAKGYGYSVGDDVTKMLHAWNAVKLDGKWHLLDSTWGAGFVDGKKFGKLFKTSFFLPPPEEFIFTHFPSDAKWQLLEKTVTLKEFSALNKMDVARFPDKAAAMRERLGDSQFRGFVGTYLHPNTKVLFVEAPFEKHLRSGARYTFRIQSAEFTSVAFVTAGNKFSYLRKEGDFFIGEITPEKGDLRLSGKRPAAGENYWSLLDYVVE